MRAFRKALVTAACGTLVAMSAIPAAAQSGASIDAEATIHQLTINSRDLDYAPTITADGRTIFFVSDRRGGFGGHDIWMATKRSRTDTVFDEPVNLGPSVNTDGNEGVASITADGRTLYFTACERSDGAGDCDIYVAELSGKSVRNVRAINEVNSPYWDSQPTVSNDGRLLFFISNRPGAVGGHGDADIYFAVRGEGGTWSPARNLGAPVNTRKREDSPFLHSNGTTLYFSSAGHGGQGGLDFFSATINADGSWTQPENLGVPFNSPRDERFISLPASGDIAYISSERRDITNRGKLDIFMARLRPHTVTVLVAGRVFDQASGGSVEAELIFVDSASGRTLSATRSDGLSGEYSLVTNPATSSTVEIYGVAMGYSAPRATVAIPAAREYQELRVDLPVDATAASVRGKADASSTLAIALHPNPASDQLTIGLTGATAAGSHAGEIIDAYGHQLRTFTFDGAGSQADVSTLASGIYLLRIDGQASAFVIRR